jgi:hypothetical protein
MTAKNNSKNSNFFENINEREGARDLPRDIYKATVKITTFSSKEEKWVQHSYEETHVNSGNRGRQLNTLNTLKTSASVTTSDSAEAFEKIESKYKNINFSHYFIHLHEYFFEFYFYKII